MQIMENFVAIFSRDGTNVEETKKFFLEHGANEVQVLPDDYIIIDDDPNKAVSFGVYGMTMAQAIVVRLEMGLHTHPLLPNSYYICVE